jgi:hypothetical protein
MPESSTSSLWVNYTVDKESGITTFWHYEIVTFLKL